MKTELTITIIVPCYNEENFLAQTLKKVFDWKNKNNISCEIIVVDDGSSDRTAEILNKIKREDVKIFRHQHNRGKGAAIRTALREAAGDICIIQDSDGEYNPNDYQDLLNPILQGEADVVYGSRFLSGKPKRSIYFAYAVGNKLLTALCNALTGLNLTDMETGYKAIKSSFIRKIILEQNRFGFEPEITIKLSKIPGIRFFEVGISYYGRSFKEGKKIRWWDGVLAAYYLVRYRFFS